ncbi:MAG: acyl-CoA thioesterase [Bacteroidales bacterium]|jgi:acyl-CoA thioester hydrolase|nr:acyl-CoA thioesterase [Bacteroidales bacterium]
MVKSEHFLDVRYYETDQMGIVHHSNYIRYFECGRNAMLKEMDMPMEKVEASGVMMAVVAVDAKYKVPAKLGDTLRIVSIIDTPPTAKVVVKTEIYNQNEQLVCTGSVTLGFIDAMTRRPVRCPEALAEIFR